MLLAHTLSCWVSLALVGNFAPNTARAQSAIEVDLQLVLAADVSGSMSPGELRLQRDGYIAALQHPDLVGAIGSGPLGRVAVTYVEWAGPNEQSIVVPWVVLSGPQSTDVFATHLAAAPTSSRGSRTAISSALLFASRQFGSSGVRSLRRTIDVSGDGVGDAGPPIGWVRDQVVEQQIIVNGLSIVLPDLDADGPYAGVFRSGDADVHAYYRNHVIGGPGAFVIAVTGLEAFADAIRRKLVLEIAAPYPALAHPSVATR